MICRLSILQSLIRSLCPHLLFYRLQLRIHLLIEMFKLLSTKHLDQDRNPRDTRLRIQVHIETKSKRGLHFCQPNIWVKTKVPEGSMSRDIILNVSDYDMVSSMYSVLQYLARDRGLSLLFYITRLRIKIHNEAKFKSH